MNIVLDRATEDDCKDLWLWRNHPGIRKNFFDNRKIPWREHQRWFQSKIKNRYTKIYVAKIKKDKVGVIRFEIEKDFLRVSVNLNPHFFGKGLGSEIIKHGTEKVLNETRTTKPIIAEIKKDNIASQKAFFKARYKYARESNEKLIYKREVTDA